MDKLNNAKKNKNDEFYTQYNDIIKELKNYSYFFKGKKVFCNCDDYSKSNFYKYFKNYFKILKLKKIFCLSINGKYIEYDGKNEVIKTLNGDFRSEDSLKILKKSDIVVTNPPFSLFREFLDLIIKFKKNFLIIGNYNAITYKNCFNYIQTNKIWIGYNCVRWFFTPNNELKEGARSLWFTNIEIDKKKEWINLKKIMEIKEYDNFKAIEVNKVKEIPDYNGIMGVPITFLEKYNPDQFQIIGSDFQVKEGKLNFLIKENWEGKLDRAYLDGKRKYSRIFIKKRNDN